MSMLRVREAKVNTPSGGYEHKWSLTAMKQPAEVIEELEKAHSEWTEMIVTIWRVKV